MNSSDLESHSSTFLMFLDPKYDVKDLDKLLMMKRNGDNGNSNNEEKAMSSKAREGRHEKKMTKREKRNQAHSNE